MEEKSCLNKNLKILRKFFFTRKFIHFGMFAICFIFASKELTKNLKEYQDDKNYIITPSFQSPDLIDLPTVSICLTNYIDETKARKYYPDLFDFDALRNMKVDERMEIYASKLSIKEILNVSLYFEQIFEECKLLSENTGKYEDCNHLNYTKVWLSLETKCYQFFHNLTVKYSPSRIKGKFWVFFKIKSERRDGSNIGFLLTTQNNTIEPFVSNPSYFPISTSVLYTIMLTYIKEITQKLEAPYNTKCINYTDPYIDQLNCSNSCVVKRLSAENDSYWPFNLPTDDHESAKYFKKNDDFHLIFNECLKNECFEQDCFSSRYLIFTKYEKFKYDNVQKFTIRLIYNFAPQTLIRYQPRINNEFSSVLSFISAPVSFWLGLAFFHLFNVIVICVEFKYRIFKKYFMSRSKQASI